VQQFLVNVGMSGHEERSNGVKEAEATPELIEPSGVRLDVVQRLELSRTTARTFGYFMEVSNGKVVSTRHSDEYQREYD
jgi:hypothetical protein